MSDLFAKFRCVLTATSEAEIRADISLGGQLVLDTVGPLTISYAPFEYVQRSAKVVIVGITPGVQQATNALIAARRQILSGVNDLTALATAKTFASFSGQMREHLVAMLDHVGLQQHLAMTTCAELWGAHSTLAHFTSALRYPVLRNGGNYSGTPSMIRTPVLKKYLQDCLAEEARTLKGALWIPCGSTVGKAVGWLVAEGLLSSEQVLGGALHPSPANIERIQYFLGAGRSRETLSSKTNPDVIDAARDAMIARLAERNPSYLVGIGFSPR